MSESGSDGEKALDEAIEILEGLGHAASQLEKSGVALQKTGKLREFAPLSRQERIDQHGESLPPGLILSGNL